jgi:hypothetical protein
MKRFILAASLALVLAPALAQAQSRYGAFFDDYSEHRHLGFFLRLDTGPGGLRSSASSGGVDASISGFAWPFGLAVGYALGENFIVGGELWGISVPSPKHSVGSQSATANDLTATLMGFGLHVTYYVMPANIYVSLTPSVVQLSESSSSGEPVSETRMGYGAKLALGKEWWVGTHWALGIAGQFFVGDNQDKGFGAPTWTTLGGGLVFSATYN